MVVPTGAVVCGRADGLHRPIERFSVSIGGSGLLRRSMTGLRRLLDDPPYQSLRLEI